MQNLKCFYLFSVENLVFSINKSETTLALMHI